MALASLHAVTALTAPSSATSHPPPVAAHHAPHASCRCTTRQQLPAPLRCSPPQQELLSASTLTFSADISRWHGSRAENRQRVLAAAKRRERGEGGGQQGSDEIDEDVRIGLNEVANEAIRVMLDEDIQKLMEFKTKVDAYGEYLVQEKEFDAARFMLVIKGMINHQLEPEAELLEGPFKVAFEKIAAIVEDSGWLLKKEGQEAMAMIDDELIPPVLRPQ